MDQSDTQLLHLVMTPLKELEHDEKITEKCDEEEELDNRVQSKKLRCEKIQQQQQEQQNPSNSNHPNNQGIPNSTNGQWILWRQNHQSTIYNNNNQHSGQGKRSILGISINDSTDSTTNSTDRESKNEPTSNNATSSILLDSRLGNTSDMTESLTHQFQSWSLANVTRKSNSNEKDRQTRKQQCKASKKNLMRALWKDPSKTA